MKLFTITTSTPIGEFHMIVESTPHGLVRVSGFGKLSVLKKRLAKNFQFSTFEAVKGNHPYRTIIENYFKGNFKVLKTIPCHQVGGVYSVKVWKAMSAIPAGYTSSYKQLAVRAGNPAAVRAAGTACAQNRLVLLVPCHRVIRSDGSIGNYLYGASVKKRLLEFEGVKF